MASDTARVEPAYGLHPYQRQVLDDLLAVLRPDPLSIVPEAQRVVAHMPTGAGKTRVACHAACNLLSRTDAEGKVVVWLASTEGVVRASGGRSHTGLGTLGQPPYCGSPILEGCIS